MLQGMRNATAGWVGRIVVGLLFGLLIISFAVWGIGDIFRGYGRNTVAMVGSTEITMDQLRTAYQNEIQRLTRQYRRPITTDQARAMGLDAQVLGRLVTDAVLDQQAKTMGLGITDAWVIRSIENDPNFRGPSGRFDRAQFADILRNNGLSEAAYLQDQRAALTRRQIPSGISGGLAVPETLREVAFRFGAERRSVDYFVLPATAITEPGTPEPAELERFFNERKTSFRAPEYRSLTVLALTPETLAKPDAVSDADARARYEQVKGTQFGAPERRQLQQLTFPDDAAAAAAAAAIKAGKSFDDIAKERGVAEKDLDLGTVSRAEIFDPAVRDAAFSLVAGGVSEPLKGRFGPVIVRVASITPEAVKPYEEVATTIKRELALAKARSEIADLHDRIEDQRASAKPLDEIAQSLGVTLTTIDGIDRQGNDKAGKPVAAVPDREALLAAAFASDMGADNEALRTADGGYVWFDITAIDASRDRPLDEVKPAVIALWRSDEIANRLAAKARELVTKIDGGEAVAAAAAGLPVKSVDQIQRGVARDELSEPAVTQIFATYAGKAGSVAVADGNARVVFKVTSATVPPFGPNALDPRLDEQISLAVTDDLLTQYVRRLQNEMGITVNQQALRNAIGAAAE
ncbi:peptidylprolyl isomerase [Chelatococcus reniformis]|uniref:Parvulin-like PPIase n=2 Tax=Chelatococcus reniformis TaxID=1494448 RepID=A0A916UEQ2_9HYPH|nr:peptidylprolyl isomerase [Chelatococcus reniformis]